MFIAVCPIQGSFSSKVSITAWPWGSTASYSKQDSHLPGCSFLRLCVVAFLQLWGQWSRHWDWSLCYLWFPTFLIRSIAKFQGQSYQWGQKACFWNLLLERQWHSPQELHRPPIEEARTLCWLQYSSSPTDGQTLGEVLHLPIGHEKIMSCRQP